MIRDNYQFSGGLMNKDTYNLDDLYIFELYEKAYDDEYYDENIDYYVKNTFFKLKDYCLCYIDDNKNVVDAITNKEVKVFIVLSLTSFGAISILVKTIKKGIFNDITIPKCSLVIL